MFSEDSSSLPYGAILSGQESSLDCLDAEDGGSLFFRNVGSCQLTQRHAPVDRNLRQHRCENFIS